MIQLAASVALSL